MISSRTLSPGERAASPHTRSGPPPPVADERLAWWQAAYFPDRPAAWGHWLDSWGGRANPAHLVEIDQPMTFDAPSRPAWLAHLFAVRAFSESGAADRSVGRGPVAAVIHPFLDLARDQMSKGLSGLGLEAAEVETCAAGGALALEERLTAMARPAAAVAANIHRLTRCHPQDSTEQRLLRFEQGVRAWPARSDLLQATPVLDRLLAQVSLDTTRALIEFAGHIAADREALGQVFGCDARHIAAVRFGLGDPHRGGRTVAQVSFVDGFDLIYKPRGLAADMAFNGLLSWLSRHLDDTPEPLQTLDRGDHGWARFIRPADCRDRAGVERAYRRTGVLLAAYDLCAGSDLHFENIVYEGINPVIVDLETLLCPAVSQQDEAANLQYRARIESILRTGYLPGGQFVQNFRRDVSAAALHSTQETPFVEHLYLDQDQDALAIRERPFVMHPRENCATLDGRRMAPADFVPELCEGMEQACAVFADHADELLAPDGPLAALKNCEVRWVARGTNVYGQAFRSSLHPAHLRDGFDHEFAWAEMAHWGPGGQVRQDVLRAEFADLWRCDIPIFLTRGDSRDAWTAAGETLPDVFHETGWDALRRRVRQLPETATDRSARTVVCAFEAVAAKGRAHPSRPVRHEETIDETACLDQAVAIGRRLQRDVIPVDDLPFWVTPQSLSKVDYAASLTAFDLYQGAAGIGLFFHELATATDDAGFRSMAEACRRMNRLGAESATARMGAFNGLAGALYAEMRLGDSTALDAAWVETMLDRIGDRLASDITLDVIGGASGVILVARHLMMDGRFASQARDLIKACAEHLSSRAEASDQGTHWPTPGFEKPSHGFAHGAAGHAAALAIAGAVANTDRWDPLIIGGMAYADAGPGGGSWCHGDIGLLTAIDLITRYRADLGQAIARQAEPWRASRRNSLADGNDSLCHGVMGNLDGLVDGSTHEHRLAGRAAAAAHRRGWLPSVGTINPGLMLGMAGIGHQLLRLRDPAIGSLLELGLSAVPRKEV